MEDERNVPVPDSVYKTEVWCHLGFCGNVRLGSAACRVPCWRAFARGAAGSIGSPRGCNFLLCWGRFVPLGQCSRRGLGAEHKYKLKNLWNPSWKVLRMFNICIYLFFTIVLFSLGIGQALYLSRCNFLFRSKCYDIVCHNCKLKLLTFKAGSKNIYGIFIKYILYIYI